LEGGEDPREGVAEEVEEERGEPREGEGTREEGLEEEKEEFLSSPLSDNPTSSPPFPPSREREVRDEEEVIPELPRVKPVERRGEGEVGMRAFRGDREGEEGEEGGEEVGKSMEEADFFGRWVVGERGEEGEGGKAGS